MSTENAEIKNNQANNEQTEIRQILERAITDPDFKTLLFSKPDEALKDYNLTEVQELLIKGLDEGDFEKLNLENLEEYFSADAAVYTPDEEVNPLAHYKVYSEEDIVKM